MILSGWLLLCILFIFLGGIFGIMYFVQKQKYSIIQRLSRELGGELYLQKNIPMEFDGIASSLRFFWGYEYLLVRDLANRKVFFAQYLQKMASQLPYVYVVFVLFETPKIFSSDEDRKQIQSDVDQIMSGAVVTETGIFYYHSIPWTVNKAVLDPVMKKLVECMNVVS